jgi:protein arginine N-methyltransferase 1
MVAEGQVIKGKVDCKPNGINPRDLDIVLDYSTEGADGAVETQTGSMKYKMS